MKYNLKFYNTLTKKIEEFKPLEEGRVGLYTCGPTVNNFFHIGHLRMYVLNDTIKRVLLSDGYKVKHVMNITDVGHLTSDEDEGEDKVEKKAALEGKTAYEIADFYTKDFLENMRKLNIILPDVIAPATKHIEEQIVLIKKIEQAGITYKTSDGIYFDTSKLTSYGFPGSQDVKERKTREDIDNSSEKKNSTDFALWKFSLDSKRQMEWESPWGVGFPGWHIECSAMAMKYLGDYFDIHTGGVDHIPVHHPNEIAQAEVVTGKKLAKYWIHGGFLNFAGEKMSKSKNNFVRLVELEENNMNPLAVRYAMFQAHYRKTVEFNLDSLNSSQVALNNLYQFIQRLLKLNQLALAKKINIQINDQARDNLEHTLEAFFQAVNNDFDMPSSLEIIWNFIKEYNKTPTSYDPQLVLNMFYGFEKILGLRLDTITLDSIPSEIEKLAEERWLAKNTKDFVEADRLREEIKEKGYIVDDFVDFYLIFKTKN